MRQGRRLAAGIAALAAALVVMCGIAVGPSGPVGFGTPALAQEAGQVPGNALGATSDSEFWRAVREGARGSVTIPNQQAGVLIQSEGENWRAARNGPLSVFGAWALFGVVAALALFFAVRGRIRIEHGRSGHLITRFNVVERFAHWLTALSFIALALSGLNMLYGRYVLLPLMSPELFADMTLAGKYLHNYLSFAFMIGLVLILVLWIRHNIPSREDLAWIAKGGGMFTRGSHPPARKFNFGQKLLFWVVILGGISISVSGIALMWPFQLPLWSKTFAVLNLVGFDLPTALAPMQEQQLSQLWHAVVGLALIAVIIGHIYIGTVGMEGAFDAMGSGKVDRNWAREHHSLWVEESERRVISGGDD